jgi:hypothetical protein
MTCPSSHVISLLLLLFLLLLFFSSFFFTTQESLDSSEKEVFDAAKSGNLAVVEAFTGTGSPCKRAVAAAAAAAVDSVAGHADLAALTGLLKEMYKLGVSESLGDTKEVGMLVVEFSPDGTTQYLNISVYHYGTGLKDIDEYVTQQRDDSGPLTCKPIVYS